ncbi:MAG: hypothetical protein KC420_19770, partial [Myxococcales bacterium]|nr:hypothetical protein [Myxococcales bacterium]
TLRYVANMIQETAQVGESEVAANVVRFEWQDGRGGVGSGWLMINKEGSALTGEIVYGVAPTGGALAYVRVEGEPPSALALAATAGATAGAGEDQAAGP